MSRFLLLDIGAGTLDVLYCDTDLDLQYKAVVKSPVRYIAERILSTPGNLVITGCEMGGGAVSAVLRDRAAVHDVAMSADAAQTIHHDARRVQAMGIKILKASQLDELKNRSDCTHLVLGDICQKRLERIVRGFGVPFEFEVIAVCAQDHGRAPRGVSHLDYRHNLFTTYLEKDPHPQALLYSRDELPQTFSRLTAIADTATALSSGEVYLMDSGMAAILGASLDNDAEFKEKILLLDIATSHTVVAAMTAGEIAGFVEYHTHDITLEKLDGLMRALPDGALSHSRILSEGGHGAYTRSAFGFEAVEAIIATGPKRRLIRPSKLPIRMGAPLGDNMMTGTAGLLEAVCIRKGIDPVR